MSIINNNIVPSINQIHSTLPYMEVYDTVYKSTVKNSFSGHTFVNATFLSRPAKNSISEEFIY